MSLLIGLDLGTTNAKALALSLDGQILASASSGFGALRSPASGWAEQDPEEVWQGAAAALRELVEKLHRSGHPGQELAGIALSGAMHSCFPVGPDNLPLAPALTWADQRAADVAANLRQRVDLSDLYQRTGCPLQPIYHIAKLRWWVEHAPAITQAALHFATIKDYVLYRLTGLWTADLSIYSATGLLDIRQYTWDAEALALAGVSPAKLPPLVSPLKIVGGITGQASQSTALPAGLAVVAGASDGGLANLGSGASQPGQSVITIGTSGAVRRVAATPTLDPQPAPRTWCYVLSEGRYFAGGAINNAGLAVQWVREKFYAELAAEAGYRQLFTDAVEIGPGAGGVMLLPFFAGERSPYWNANARATLTGLGLEHDRRHIARAVLEAVAFRLGTIWQALAGPEQNQETDPIRLTGGVLQTPAWAQIVCDVLGAPLTAVEAGDASAVGAAMLGQSALGLASSLDDLAARVHSGANWQPDPERHARYSQQLERFQALYRQLYTA